MANRKNYNGTYYTKIVSKDELDDVFLVKFTAYIDNQKFTLMDLKNNKVLILSDDQVYAKEHSFIDNHGLFEVYKSLDLTNNIQMIYSSETNNTETITNLTIQEFISLWNKYNVDIYIINR